MQPLILFATGAFFCVAGGWYGLLVGLPLIVYSMTDA